MPGSNERQNRYFYNCLMYGTLYDSQAVVSRFCGSESESASNRHFNYDKPYLNYAPGAEAQRKTVSVLDRDLKVTVYTRSANSKGLMPTANGFRKSLVAITFLVFDINDEQSFNDLAKHIETIKEKISYFSDGKPYATEIVLIGNKHDEDDFRVIDAERAKTFARKHEIPYFETNTITGDNITEAFTCGIRLRLEKKQEKQDIVRSLEEYKTKVFGEYSHSFSFLFRNPQRKNAKLQFVQQVIDEIGSKRKNRLSDIEIRLAVEEILMTNSKNDKSEITFKGVFDGILSHRCIDLICQITNMSREELHNMISDIYSSREKVNDDDSKYSETPAPAPAVFVGTPPLASAPAAFVGGTPLASAPAAFPSPTIPAGVFGQETLSSASGQLSFPVGEGDEPEPGMRCR
jgi:Ras family